MVQMTAQTIATAARKIRDNIELVVVGKSDVVELVLVAVLCDGSLCLVQALALKSPQRMWPMPCMVVALSHI